MGVCKLCGAKGVVISDVIGVCSACLRSRGEEAVSIAMKVHSRYRSGLGLPVNPPNNLNGVKCGLCVNECVIGVGETGYCGLWLNDGGLLKFVEGFNAGVLYAYLDPLPTNCVATPVCPAATGCDYPRYSVSMGSEYGYYNLAVFFAGCNLNCVFCQNLDHKNIVASQALRKRYVVSKSELVEKALNNDRVTCICYFGGDPGPHILYALEVSKVIVDEARRRGLVKRICWETNGLENPGVMREMARLSLESGGIVKIDWKAYTPEVYQALTGVNGYKAVERIKENIRIVAEMARERPEVPLLTISILLVPGYVDEKELMGMAEYIASIDNEIPVVLLAFHPDHLLKDLPPTSIGHAAAAVKIFKGYGVERVFIGNEWLLGPYY
ncbi:radical SAM protein [Ignisphaera sp. 4213-co]|uniref:Radical SAM protein n=1 Tax=Ignisphaera cupida TaxID=3050454 RepID=A0ABD4Z411_9CREN|nr:radical SAM protein [Ignisphaera sp. 4213-co]MDK6028061.1 radical SAM protein [Ignisphaera sp. 4213-co]